MKAIAQLLTAVFLHAVSDVVTLQVHTVEQSFRSPPESARRYTWWHWMDGNVSKEGITKDLEAMKAVGIGGFQHFDVGLRTPQGPVLYNSAKFHELLAFAIAESERLGLDAGFNHCSGWSSSGGSWMKPEDSMKALVLSESQLRGGDAKPVILSVPEFNDDRLKRKQRKQSTFYRDVAVLAFPTPKDNEYRIKEWQDKSLYNLEAKAERFAPDRRITPADAVIPAEKLINLTDDRGESNDLALRDPDRVSQLAARWTQFARDSGMSDAKPAKSEQRLWGWRRLQMTCPQLTALEPANSSVGNSTSITLRLTFNQRVDFRDTDGKTIRLFAVSDESQPVWRADPDETHPSQGTREIVFDNIPHLTPDRHYFVLWEPGWVKVGGKPIGPLNEGAFWWRFRTPSKHGR